MIPSLLLQVHCSLAENKAAVVFEDRGRPLAEIDDGFLQSALGRAWVLPGQTRTSLGRHWIIGAIGSGQLPQRSE
jgi:hypothetical protein